MSLSHSTVHKMSLAIDTARLHRFLKLAANLRSTSQAHKNLSDKEIPRVIFFKSCKDVYTGSWRNITCRYRYNIIIIQVHFEFFQKFK